MSKYKILTSNSSDLQSEMTKIYRDRSIETFVYTHFQKCNRYGFW